MQQAGISKKTIIIVVVLLVGGFGYYLMSGSSSPSNSLLSAREAGGVGAQELALLNQIKLVSIDSTFFESAAFKSLKDFSVEIRKENVGRPNPFASVPGVPSPFTAEPTPNQRSSR